MAAQPPELVDDVVGEILLRLPPDEPKWLFRAALACKPWLRTISDPTFLHRYRVFHGAPPLLGLIGSGLVNDGAPLSVATPLLPDFGKRVLRFLATTAVPAFPIPVSDSDVFAYPEDCRHGRILILKHEMKYGYCYLVCDPITGDCHRVPEPGFGSESLILAATIFCAITGCRHLDCHDSPFYVSLVFSEVFSTNMWAIIYSSETRAWSTPSPTLDHICANEEYGRGALVGEGIYFPMRPGDIDIVILKYDWRKNCLSVLRPPPLAMHKRQRQGWVALTVIKDTSLGLAVISDSSLYLWSRAVGSEENAEWVQCRVIDLGKMIPMANPRDRAHVVGVTEGAGVIFISTGVGLFMMELRSGRAKKIGKPRRKRQLSVLPYMSFYTPDRNVLLGGPTIL